MPTSTKWKSIYNNKKCIFTSVENKSMLENFSVTTCTPNTFSSNSPKLKYFAS